MPYTEAAIQCSPIGRKVEDGDGESWKRARRTSSAISTTNFGDAGNPVRQSRDIHRTNVFSSALERI